MDVIELTFLYSFAVYAGDADAVGPIMTSVIAFPSAFSPTIVYPLVPSFPERICAVMILAGLSVAVPALASVPSILNVAPAPTDYAVVIPVFVWLIAPMLSTLP